MKVVLEKYFFRSENKIEYIVNLVGLMKKKKRLVFCYIIRKYIKIWMKGDIINEKFIEMFFFFVDEFLLLFFCFE